MYKKFYNSFLDILGEPSSIEKLKEYINFVLDNEVHESLIYCELHHIVPQCIIKNKVTFLLTYEDHCTAHCLLFEAYPIAEFQRPLNFMLSDQLKTLKTSGEYKDRLSKIRKVGWEKFKLNKEKYSEWRINRSKHQTDLMLDKGYIDNISSKIKEYWKALKGNDELYNNYINNVKASWDNDRRAHMSKKMANYYSIEKNRELKSIEARERYNNMSTADKSSFHDKMVIVNSNIDKRDAASKSIKSLWATEEFRNKMSNRKTRKVLKYTMNHINGRVIYHDGLNSLAEKYNMNLSLLRKFMNTSMLISSHMQNTKTLNTIDWRVTSNEA